MFKKILVPYDRSEPADNAIKSAVGLATAITHNNCEIMLVTVVPQLPVSQMFLLRPIRTREGEIITLSHYVEQSYEQMKKNIADMLEKKQREIEVQVGGSKTTVRTIVVIGDEISEKILEVAEKENVDLIIVGNAGLGGFAKLKALGSVSRSISERASCPVMIVH